MLCRLTRFAAVVLRCSPVVYPLRSCLVVTANEHPSLPGRSSMLPQSGCLSRRTSASVRDTGRKHLQVTHTHTHTPGDLSSPLQQSIPYLLQLLLCLKHKEQKEFSWDQVRVEQQILGITFQGFFSRLINGGKGRFLSALLTCTSPPSSRSWPTGT